MCDRVRFQNKWTDIDWQKFHVYGRYGVGAIRHQKMGAVDEVPLSEKFIGDPYIGMVYGRIVTSFLDSLITGVLCPLWANWVVPRPSVSALII